MCPACSRVRPAYTRTHPGALRAAYLVKAFRELEEASEEGAPRSVFAEALGVPLQVHCIYTACTPRVHRVCTACASRAYMHSIIAPAGVT